MLKTIRILIPCLLMMCFISGSVTAQVQLHSSSVGDYQLYLPKTAATNILVVAHGMLGKNQQAAQQARTYAERWIPYAEQHGLIIIAPVFDDERFGNLSQGYGGYRNLFGKYISADDFVNRLVAQYSRQTRSGSNQFYLYGHSAGGRRRGRGARGGRVAGSPPRARRGRRGLDPRRREQDQSVSPLRLHLAGR